MNREGGQTSMNMTDEDSNERSTQQLPQTLKEALKGLQKSVRRKRNAFQQQTQISTLRSRKILVDSVTDTLSSRFFPTNPSEAKTSIKRVIKYDLSNTQQNSLSPKNSKQQQHIKIDESGSIEGSVPTQQTFLQPNNFRVASISPNIFKKQSAIMNSKNVYTTFLHQEDEQPRLAVLQRFKDINRVMTDTFLKQTKDGVAFQNKYNRRDPDLKYKSKEEYTQKMVSIMKEMQSPKKFNSPYQRRNLFQKRPNYPVPIRQGDTIIQGMPIQIQYNSSYIDDDGATVPGEVNQGDLILNNSYITMNNEEDQRMREGRSFGDELNTEHLNKGSVEVINQSALDLVENSQ